MMALFPLYLCQQHGYRPGSAVLLCGVFSGLSYLACLPGGYLSDRYLGQGRAAVLGVIALSIGYVGLAMDESRLVWPAVVVLLIGHGLFKPSLSTLIGKLYRTADRRRDSGFAIFYLAVNLGYLLGPLIAEWSRARWAWRGVFGSTAGMMFVGLLITGLGRLSIEREAKVLETRSPERMPSPANEASQVRAVFILCSVATIFWLAMQQTSGSLILFAQDHTARLISIGGYGLNLEPGYFTALHGGLVLVLLPLMMGRAPSNSLKMIWGFVFISAAFALLGLASLRGGDIGRVSPLWLVGFYMLMAPGEIWLSAMGLSLVTQLAPQRMTSRLVGLWFSSVAVGNWLGGIFGLLWGRWSNHHYFALLGLLSFAAASVLFTRLQRLETAIGLRT